MSFEKIYSAQEVQCILSKERFADVSGINQNKVEQRYNQNLFEWQYIHSSEVKIDGELINEGKKKMFLLAGFKQRPEPIKSVEINKFDVGGLPLDELHFIDIALKRSTKVLIKTKGKEINRTKYAETKIYIDYLEQRKKDLESPLSKYDYNLLSSILKDFQVDVSPEILKSIIEDKKLPEKVIRPVWRGGTTAWEFINHFKEFGEWKDKTVFTACFDFQVKPKVEQAYKSVKLLSNHKKGATRLEDELEKIKPRF